MNQSRLIDLMCHIDPSLLEEEYPDKDLEKQEISETVSKWNKKKIAVISGIAAGSLALTGIAIFALKKTELFRKAA